MIDFYDDDDDDEIDDERWGDEGFDYLTGRLLIAMPGIDDPRFERAVILMCAHSPDHAMGITVNRPMDSLSVPQLLERLGVNSSIAVPARPVLVGGPVERERGFVLHTDDYCAPDSTLAVLDGVALTATRDILEAIAGDAPPRCAVLALGCAGWSPGQLEREIKDNVWLTCDADEALNALYAGDHDRTDPLVSPLFGDFTKGFPPTHIQSGTRDRFLSNAVRLHRSLRRAGRFAELHVWEAAPHGGFPHCPEGRESRAEVQQFLQRLWG